MRNSVCNKRRLRGRARPSNGDVSLFQRFLKMGASTADCIWQRAESIPELLNPERNTIMKYRLLGKSGLRVSEASLGCPDPEWCRHNDHPRVRHDVMLERRPRRARLGCGPGGDSPGEAARDCRTA